MYYYARDIEDFPQPERFGRALMWPEEALRAWRIKHPARGSTKKKSPSPDDE